MKKILAILLCILCLSGCSKAPEVIVEPQAMSKEDFVGVYATEYYTSRIGVDNPEYTKSLGDADEDKFVHPGSEAVVELREDGVVLYGNEDREISEVGTWSYNEGEVTIDTPNISTDFNEGITISCMGIDLSVFYGYSGIPHERTNYYLTRLTPEYVSGEYVLKSGMDKDGYYSVADETAKKTDTTLSLKANGKYKYKSGDTKFSGTWKTEGINIVLEGAEGIEAEYTNGRVFVIEDEKKEMLIKG